MIITLNYEDVRQLVAEALSRRLDHPIDATEVLIDRAAGAEDVEVSVEVGIDVLQQRVAS